MNWVFISQKTTFFIVTAVKTSNLTIILILYNIEAQNFLAEDSTGGLL
jgi:hypothetical protein